MKAFGFLMQSANIRWDKAPGKLCIFNLASPHGFVLASGLPMICKQAQDDALATLANDNRRLSTVN